MTTFEEPTRSRTAGLSWYDLVLEHDHPVLEHLRERHHYSAATQLVAVERYTSRAWHELERIHWWRRVWQMACRQEHLPEVGSYIVYDIAGDSYPMARTRHGSIQAYVNAFRYRGRALGDADRRCSEFRCSFHGFTWKLDGTLRYFACAREIPCDRGRPPRLAAPRGQGQHLGRLCLPRSRPEGRAAGGVRGRHARTLSPVRLREPLCAAVRREAGPLSLEGSPGETFDEGLHLAGTHPPRRHQTSATATAQWRCTTTTRVRSTLPVLQRTTCPWSRPNTTSWLACSTFARANDAVFPNLHPWNAYNRIVYRFRPNGDRHDECIFEVMFLTPVKGERPPPAPIRWIDLDESWTLATELRTLALVMEQDTFNMTEVRRGLQTTRRSHLLMSYFQEDLVPWRHDLLTDWVERGAEKAAAGSRARSSKRIPRCVCGSPLPVPRAIAASTDW